MNKLPSSEFADIANYVEINLSKPDIMCKIFFLQIYNSF